jgi:hypothetical protein
MKHSLSTTGLSLSQAQSISNLCFQRTQEIANQLAIINNSEKTLTIGTTNYTETVGNKIPTDVVDLVLKKGLLHATQAFLMENIKAKDVLIRELKAKVFISELEQPVYPKLEQATLLPLVDEKWGWEQLSVLEYNEYLEAESYAAHIGQFIHKGEKLDVLRKELPFLKTLEWINVEDGKKTPLKVSIHHTSTELSEIHEQLAAKHRQYEQRVNYFKAKVKNLTTEENARRSAENNVLLSKINAENEVLKANYINDLTKYNAINQKESQIFEEKRQEDIKKTSALRIHVDPRFQPIVDVFLKQLEDK